MHQASPVLQENLVGLELRLKEISTLLEVSSEDVKFIGIWGLGGIGKTTIARAVFAKFSSRFQFSCFLADVRETHNKHGLEALQATLFSKLLKERPVQRNEGIDQMIKFRLRWRKVLIVLDDVDRLEQLEKLVGNRDWFHKGSTVIITTRDKGLLQSHRVVEIYEVKKLDEENALKLFSWHAFKKEYPINGFEDVSTSFVRHASGLPLTLKVWGSFLCGRRDKKVWESTLEKIKDIPDKEVITKLKISFDGLDDGDKNIFLDVACFFRKKSRDCVEDVLKSCDLHPDIGISVLIERCLLFESNGCIDMHDLIQEMGLIWQLDDLLDVVEPEATEGLFITSRDRYSYNENIDCLIEAFKRMRKLKILMVEGYGNDFFSNRMNSSEFQESFGTSSIMDNYLPGSLSWLDFSYYHLFSLPESFHPSKLVGFHLPHSSLKTCTITKNLNKLVYLDLSFSRFLLETPNFQKMPNLERLYLPGCENLNKIHPSIGYLEKLVVLDLGECSNLEKLPNFVQVKSLELLNLGFCRKLENFPEIQGIMPDLLELELKSVGIRKLPLSIQQLHGLTELRLVDCENLVCLSSSLCELKYLKVIELERCFKLESLPENLGNSSQLEKLHVQETAILRLPSSIMQLSSIVCLYFGFGTVIYRETTSNVVVPGVSGMFLLKRLELCFLHMLDEGLPQDIGCLKSLEYLNLSGNKFVRLPESISQLPCLKYLDITSCRQLEELPELPATIRELYADPRFAFESNIAELATKYSELYSISFAHNLGFFVSCSVGSKTHLTKKFIHFSGSFLRKTPLSVIHCSDVIGSNIERSFKYQCHGTKRISIDLEPFWYGQNFLGFVVCCLLPSRDVWESHPEFGLLEHCAVRANLAHKDNRNEVLQTKCVIANSDEYKTFYEKCTCFAYIPFSSLWAESKAQKDGVTPNDYSTFEAFLDPQVSTNWGCSLLYKEDELRIEAEIDPRIEDQLFERYGPIRHYTELSFRNCFHRGWFQFIKSFLGKMLNS